MKCNVRKNSNDDAQSSHVRREGGRGRKRGEEGKRDWGERERGREREREGGRGREGLGRERERERERESLIN